MIIALSITTAIGFVVAVCAVVFARTVVAQAARDRAGDRATIDMLCQRIQAPELAIAEHASARSGPDVRAVDLNDDDDWHDARDEVNSGRTS